MKLHLPKGLRTAVIACITAVSGFSFTVTSGVLAGGSVAYMLAGQQALATDATIEQSSGEIPLGNYGEGDNITLKVTGGYLATSSKTYSANLIIENFVINNGYTGSHTYTFTGSVSGSGAFTRTNNQSGNAFVFTGNMSAYSGDMTIQHNNIALTFQGNTTGTGTINTAASLNVQGATVKNSSITAATLNISGTSSFSGNITSTTTNVAAGTVATLSGGTNSLGALTLDLSSCTTSSSVLLTSSNAITATSLALQNTLGLENGTYSLLSTTNDAAAALVGLYTDSSGEKTLTNENGLIKMTVVKGSGPVVVDSGTLNVPFGTETTRGYNVSNGATLGINNGSGGQGSAAAGSSYGYGPITVDGTGTTLNLWSCTFSARTLNTNDKAAIASDITLTNGGKIHMEDGSYHLSGALTVTGEGEVDMKWAKGVVIKSINSTEGDSNQLVLKRMQNDGGGNSLFKVAEEGNFSGTLKVDNAYAGTCYLAVSNTNALKNAVVELSGTSILALDAANVNVKGLKGHTSVGLANSLTGNAGVTAATLNITGNSGEAVYGSIASGVTLDVNAGGALTLGGGTVELYSAIENHGSITLGSDVKFDVTHLTSIPGEGDDVVYQLINNVGAGSITGFADLAASAIIGVVAEKAVFAANGTVTISKAAPEEITWDENWPDHEHGVLPYAPTETTVALYGKSSVMVEGDPAANLNGAGASGMMVFGGQSSDADSTGGNLTNNAWIYVSDGTYKAIVGGNYCNNWNAGSVLNLIGDTHIQLDGENVSVGNLVGGNLKDGKTPKMTGDSFISVMKGDVKSSIIGSGTNSHANNTTQDGSTHIYIYTPLSTTGAAGDSLSGNVMNVVVGGTAHVDNPTDNNQAHLTGSTEIHVDLSGYEGDKTTFVKTIVGGHYNKFNGQLQDIGGSTTVDIKGADVTFSGEIVAGNVNSGANSSITGGTNLSIEGGTYTAMITGGSKITGNLTSTNGAAVVKLGGEATFNCEIYAAGHAANGTSTVESTEVSLGNKVSFGESAVLSGGFGGTATNMTVTGDKVLKLTEAAEYSNLASLTLKSFDVVDVVEGGKATIGTIADTPFLEKTGKGSLTMTSGLYLATTVSEGTLVLDGAAVEVGYTTVASGSTLEVTSGSSAAALVVLERGSVLAVGEGGLALTGDESGLEFGEGTGAITFTTTAAITSQVIVASGLTADTLSGITFNKTGALGQYAVASDYLTLTGDLADFDSLRLDESGNLVLEQLVSSKMYWGKGNQSGEWNLADKKWGLVDAVEGSELFENGKDAYFTLSGGGGAITTGAAIEVGNIIVSGTEAYTFSNGTGGSLAIQKGVTVAEGADATFNMAVNGTDVAVKTAAGAKLTLNESSDVKSVTNVGTITVASGKTLKSTDAISLADGSTLAGAGTYDATAAGVTVTGGTATVKDGATVQANTVGGSGTLKLNTATLATSGTATVAKLGAEGTGNKVTGSAVTITSLTMSGTGSELTVGGGTVVTALTMSADSQKLASEGALTLGSTTAAVGQVTATDALTVTGAVQLTSVKAGSVDISSGAKLTTTGTIDSSSITLNTLSKTEQYVKAENFAAASTDFLVADSVLENLDLAAGASVTIAVLGADYGTSNLKLNGVSAYTDTNIDKTFVISQKEGTYEVVLTAKAAASDYVWEDTSTDHLWSTDSNWAKDMVPDTYSYVQFDTQDYVEVDVPANARRVTVGGTADMELRGEGTQLSIGQDTSVTGVKTLEVLQGGKLKLTNSLGVVAPETQVQGELSLEDQTKLTTDTLDLTSKDGSTSGILSVDSGATVTTGVLTGDADSLLEGPGTVTITGKGSRYQGNYAGATVAVAKGGDAVLYAGEGMNLAGAGSAQLVYTQDTAISSIQADGLTLTLNNAAADNSGVTLALEDGSSLKNGKILTGLSAVGTAATIDSADAPTLVSTTASPLKRSAGTPGLDLTGSTVVLTQSEGADVTQMEVNNGGKTKGLVLAYLGAANTESAVQLNGNLFAKYYKNARLVGGEILVDMNDTYYQGLVRPTTANGRAGTAMLDDAFVLANPQQTSPDSDLAKLMDALESGAVPAAGADKLAAAVSGASAAAMGAAFGADVDRQLRAIRNRTTSMGCAECVVNEEMPYVNAWVNAEGDYRKLDADSTLAGYKMSSWGATLGVDLDFTNRFTAGLAVTAMQGDFTADSAETATGDLDRLYLSAFARYSRRAWTHTAVVTFGKADANLKRTVDYGTGSYTAKGDMSGTAFGLMYEVGYTKALTEDASVCLQPVFNISYRHSSLGSYTETGSDAALRMGDMEMDTVTFGLGARMQGTVGTSVYNRTSVVELRALAKLDAGDRDCAAKAGIAGLPAASREVQSAEYGAFGVEVGAGLLVPLGEYGGTLFCDAAAELRSGYTNVNGTVGYRFNF